MIKLIKFTQSTHIFFDFKKIINYPNLYKSICNEIYNKINKNNKFDNILLNNEIKIFEPFLCEEKKLDCIYFNEYNKHNYNNVVYIDNQIISEDYLENKIKLCKEKGYNITQIITFISNIKKDNKYDNIEFSYLYHKDDFTNNFFIE